MLTQRVTSHDMYKEHLGAGKNLTSLFKNKLFSPQVEVSFNDKTVNGLIDSGSVRSIMLRRMFESIKHNQSVLKRTKSAVVCRSACNSNLQINLEALCMVKIDAFTWNFPLLVAEGLSCDLILGADIIHHTRLVLDIHQGIIYFKFRPKNLISLCDRKNSPEGCQSNLLEKGPFDVGTPRPREGGRNT